MNRYFDFWSLFWFLILIFYWSHMLSVRHMLWFDILNFWSFLVLFWSCFFLLFPLSAISISDYSEYFFGTTFFPFRYIKAGFMYSLRYLLVPYLLHCVHQEEAIKMLKIEINVLKVRLHPAPRRREFKIGKNHGTSSENRRGCQEKQSQKFLWIGWMA